MGWLLHEDQVVLKGTVGYPPRPGAPMILAAKKVFREASLAEDAAAHLRSLVAHGSLPPDTHITGVETIGPTLLIFSELR